MRPLIFLIGLFGFLYTLWSFAVDATGSETSVLSGIAYAFYRFGRIFYAPSNPLSGHQVYLITVAFFLVLFLAMALFGILTNRKG